MTGRFINCLITLLLIQLSRGDHIPPPEAMCSLVVDDYMMQDCLDCFEIAPPLIENPDPTRDCINKYMPPLIATCVVAHVRRTDEKTIHGNSSFYAKRDEELNNNGQIAVGQEDPDVHDSHMNANLLPNCIRRRIRQLNRYIHVEEIVTKNVDDAFDRMGKFLPQGEAYMLNIAAIRKFVQLFKTNLPNMKIDDECRHVDPDVNENTLPMSGLGEVAYELIHGECIIHNLIADYPAHHEQIFDFFTTEDYHFPIPSTWVQPLFDLAKGL